MAEASIEHMGKIAAGLDGDAGLWDSYAAGRRSLVFAFVSKTDQTLVNADLRTGRTAGRIRHAAQSCFIAQDELSIPGETA